MNRFLASALSTLNALLAILIVAGFTLSGGAYGEAAGQSSGLGMIVGLIAGIFVAATVCGLIAFLTLIERHLSEIATASDYQNQVLKFIADRQSDS